MSKFFTHNQTKQPYRVYSTISNGIILTHFNEKTGTPIVNEGYQLFVTKEQLKNEFTPFTFRFQTSDAINTTIIRNLPDFIYQFKNYGVAENLAEEFDNFYNTASAYRNVYESMVTKGDKLEYTDLLPGDDDHFEFSGCEDLFNMVTGGMIPIIKKMIIEAVELSKT